ncbi:uncharacterized protein F4812DRAFT_432658 [Daldinia caldariorum]|uniref:uncharacterized protein n=1 Tax=Daldinia caldariorum TaxID=326644 RepID=UPI00200734CD|nr:uncharacterized protein F4812DRAFT_432658 [Daldinia caldariorum]KAI1466746.1 hypothetical protein F4812DRAFT_432658 [Daldinia caldariorum]
MSNPCLSVSQLVCDRKMQMIEAWVSEVEASQIYCVCSRRRVLPKIEEQAATPESPIDSGLSSLTAHARKPGRRGPPKCAVCRFPFDGNTKFEKLREFGEMGLVRCGSPRSVYSLDKETKNKLGPQSSFLAFGTRKRQRPKQTTTKDSSISDSFENFKSRSRRSLTSFRTKFFDWFDNDHTIPEDRPRATEAYAQYRCHDTPTASMEDLWSGDDNYRKPELTLDETAARLRRAAHLLSRINP